MIKQVAVDTTQLSVNDVLDKGFRTPVAADFAHTLPRWLNEVFHNRIRLPRHLILLEFMNASSIDHTPLAIDSTLSAI